MQAIQIRLSKLEASRKNPRRVKPERDSHRRLVASIWAHGLIEPLVVMACPNPIPEHRGMYRVIAGNRRLAALRDAYRDEDPLIDCMVREAGEAEARSLGLAENVIREPMHPLDEAEAFAKLGSVECKGVTAIAADFGVSDRYVRQRIALAGLIPAIKDAFRRNEFGVGVAEALASVPAGRQEAVWQELGGRPRSAEHVWGLIREEWIPAERALFELSVIDPADLSQNLFGGETLIAREAFLRAQQQALELERGRLIEEGWLEVVAGTPDHVGAAASGYREVHPDYDPETTKALEELEEQRDALSGQMLSDEEYDERAEHLDQEEARIRSGAVAIYPEAVKSRGTVFLVLSPDGTVQRRYAAPRQRGKADETHQPGEAVGEPDAPPTCDDLTAAQRAQLRTHELLAVREALLGDPFARKRILIMALHDNVGREAIMVRRHASGADLLAGTDSDFRSSLKHSQVHRRQEADPFFYMATVSEVGMYERLKDLSEEQLDALLAHLTVRLLTNNLDRRASLIGTLLRDFTVDVRKYWTPEASWLAGYRKAQLADLIGKLQGPAHRAAALRRKKSELLAEAAGLFRKAAEGPDSLGDADLAERVCRWVPEDMVPAGNEHPKESVEPDSSEEEMAEVPIE